MDGSDGVSLYRTAYTQAVSASLEGVLITLLALLVGLYVDRLQSLVTHFRKLLLN